MPRISVIILTDDHECIVGEAVESLLSLSRPACEAVFVDDGSADYDDRSFSATRSAGPDLPALPRTGQEHSPPSLIFS